MRLWQEHLGLAASELSSIVDATCDRVYKDIWLHTAHKNTGIYERVFPSIPRNEHTTMKVLRSQTRDGTLLSVCLCVCVRVRSSSVRMA